MKGFFDVEKNNYKCPVDESKLTLLTSPLTATIYLDGILNYEKIIAFDFETTGLKPHAEGHKILCMSISTGETATAFPIFDDRDFLRTLRRIFKKDSIKKIAHNMKFETTWTKEILNCQIKGWYWDTMLVQHVLDNSSHICGLKYQIKKRYDVEDYDLPIKKYIKAENKSSNSFNKMDQCPEKEMLQYCAIDSLFTFKLYQDQLKELKNKKAYDLFHEGALALSDIHQQGIKVNTDYFNQQKKKLLRQLERLHKKINNSDEAKQYPTDDFNFNSAHQLGKLLFDILDYKVIKRTPSGKPSADYETLSKIKTPFVQDIIKWKKLDKILNTYLEGFIRESVNGILRPNYNLHSTRTYRSSSSNPNFQNVPKRDVEAQKIIRSGIIPSEGNQIMEVDYSGIEVRISACYHKDPTMINYIEDPLTDMHRDMAKEIFILDEITKELRQEAKNKFVFPQFYGSYYAQCAPALWQSINKEIKNHLKEKGIKNYNQFEKHIEKVENYFWNQRFKVYTNWKDNTWNAYNKKGFIKSLTGFYYTSRMKRNDVLNYPIQGAAFHCLLWSLIQIHKFLKKNKYKTKIIGQVHDSIIFDICPDELKELLPIIKRIMCEDIREYWNWIIVPLDVEAEISEVNGNWYEMKEIKI